MFLTAARRRSKDSEKEGRNYEKNCPRSRKRHRMNNNAELNEAIYRWYCLARERSIGPLLKEEALLIAMELDPNSTFKAFKKCHNMKVSGECTDVSEETVTSLNEFKCLLLAMHLKTYGMKVRVVVFNVGVGKTLRRELL